MEIDLTEDAISMLSSGKWKGSTDSKPVLQVIDIRSLPTQSPAAGIGNKGKYSVVLSDGLYHQLGVVDIRGGNEVVGSKQLQKGSVVQLTEFVCTMIRDRIIILVTDLDVIIEKANLIGNPKPCLLKPGGESPLLPRTSAPMQSLVNQTRSDAEISRPKEESVAEISRPPVSSNTYNQPPPMYMNTGPIVPISALNPYQNWWTIKARVTGKRELRSFTNAKGEGKVFSFDLLDFDGGEIQVTCFNNMADLFYNQIQTGNVYFISRGRLKRTKTDFNHLHNDYEITLNVSSTVQPCFEENNLIPQRKFSFRPISKIEGMNHNCIVDVIGMVSGVAPSWSVTKKNGTETRKRTLHLKDMSGRSVELTLWGAFSDTEGRTLQNMCDSGLSPVLAVKSARVNAFSGKSLGTISTSRLCVEPDIPEAKKLKTWFENMGRYFPSVSISRDTLTGTQVLKTVSQIKDERLGTSEKPDWITVNATILHIKDGNFCYPACPIMVGGRQCNKKVTNDGDGKWRCDKCDQNVDQFDYRYILQFQIQDHSGSTWVTAFQESSEAIMGISAKELYAMKHEEQDEDRFTETIRSVLFSKYSLKLRVKEEIFGDEQHVKSVVVRAEKIKASSDTRFLLDLLKGKEAISTVVKSEIRVSDSGLDCDSQMKYVQKSENYFS